MKKNIQKKKPQSLYDCNSCALTDGSLPISIQLKKLCLNKEGCNLFTSQANKVLLVVRGQVECSLDGYPVKTVSARSMFFVRTGMLCQITAVKESLLVIFRTGSDFVHRDSAVQAYISGTVANSTTKDLLELPTDQLPVLPFNSHISNFAAGMLPELPYMVTDEFYAGIKMREFFFLVGFSYSHRDRIRFFESLDSTEQSFAAFIYRNYKQAKSVSELAKMACYSLSGFEKRFRKIFGQPASKWIAIRKAQMIHTEICDTTKPFKTLSYEYGFSCPSHFTRFCHKYLGGSPASIRSLHIEKSKQNNI